MKPHHERHAALMRCHNTETCRKRLWRQLGLLLASGRLNAEEVAKLKRVFWADRAELKKATGAKP